jgi:hypothetical protein
VCTRNLLNATAMLSNSNVQGCDACLFAMWPLTGTNDARGILTDLIIRATEIFDEVERTDHDTGSSLNLNFRA